MAVATPSSVEAADFKVENGVTYVHPHFKGAIGAGWVPLETTFGVSNSTQRRESVAGFRVETDEQGRSWVWRHPRFKGAVGAGWERVPLDKARNN
ncbi:hypothetical protein EON83_01495 [bacterium]|nr:MAG: hypothetical protein EON83_01495 [bacterium]